MSDLLNGLFEFGAAVACVFHILAILKDRQIKGFSKWPILFYTLWGLYNLYYYPHLGQWWSFAGGVCIVICNCVWISLIWKYRNNEHS